MLSDSDYPNVWQMQNFDIPGKNVVECSTQNPRQNCCSPQEAVRYQIGIHPVHQFIATKVSLVTIASKMFIFVVGRLTSISYTTRFGYGCNILLQIRRTETNTPIRRKARLKARWQSGRTSANTQYNQ